MTLSKNATGRGGGVFIQSGTASIVNSTIAFNKASSDGGGLMILGGTVTVHNSTLAKNSSKGAGGGLENASVNALEIISTIIAGNSAHTDADIIGKINASFDLIQHVTAGTVFATDTSNIKNMDPLLGALGLHGGTTPTMLPSIKAAKPSPVIDQGSNPDALMTDQRGDPRMVGAGIDIGAVEVA